MKTKLSIPGTFVDPSVADLQWRRDAGFSGPNRAQRFQALVRDGLLMAVLSRDLVPGQGLLWHLSVSHQVPRVGRDSKLIRCPTWDELKHAKHYLVPVDVTMNIIFPRRSSGQRGTYVNEMPTTLHLWECGIEQEL